MAAKSKPNEIHIIRLLNAPVRAVWDAWTDPAQAAQWWGPRGFTLTTHGKDLRPGGHWTYTMHGPDGVDWPNKTIYHEVEECAKLVYDHGGHDDRPPLFHVVVLFSEVNGKTKMDMTMTFKSTEDMDAIRKHIKKAGGEGTWDRLAEYVDKQTTGRDKFVIARTFDAPLELMYQMWTDPKHFSKWLPPTGFEMQFIRADIKPGGSTFYYMTGPNGVKMYGRAEYKSFEKPNRLVYSQQFCDENERVTRHPFSPTWPETMLTVVELAEEAPDRTRVTVTWEPVGPSSEELETFLKARGGMTQEWTGSMDKLEEYLENTQGT